MDFVRHQLGTVYENFEKAVENDKAWYYKPLATLSKQIKVKKAHTALRKFRRQGKKKEGRTKERRKKRILVVRCEEKKRRKRGRC